MVETRTEIISPQRAAEYLTRNIHNRPSRQERVDEWVAELRAGRWKLTHQGIAFDSNNVLIDGQHRLRAIVASGIAAQMQVTRGLEPDVQDVVDVGWMRSAGHALQLAGYGNYTRLAAAVRWQLLYEQDMLSLRYIRFSSRFPPAQIVAYVQNHPEMVEANSISAQSTPRDLVPPSVLVWLNYLFSQEDPERAQEFWQAVLTGVSLAENSARFAVRTRLLNLYKQRGVEVYRAALIVRGWQYDREGLEVSTLLFKSATTEFPRVEQTSRGGELKRSKKTYARKDADIPPETVQSAAPATAADKQVKKERLLRVSVAKMRQQLNAEQTLESSLER